MRCLPVVILLATSLALPAAATPGLRVDVVGAIDARDGLEVAGTLTSWPWAAADVAVAGLLRNTGTIQDGAHPVRVTALGHVENLGTMTMASLDLAGAEDQRLTVHDLMGRRVATLVDGALAAGPHAVTWRRRELPSGTCSYRLQTAGEVIARRALLVK